MNVRYLYIFLVLFFPLYGRKSASETEILKSSKDEHFIVTVTASYNNAKYYKQNIDSLVSQQYSNCHFIYVDDCSSDGTYDLVKAYIESIGVDNRFTLIRNEKRIGAMANQFNAIQCCPDRAIIAIVDGDDRLAHPKVFERLNREYSTGNIWLTYGQFRVEPGGHVGWCRAIPSSYVQRNAFRDYMYNLSHLRTFYAGLFKQIKEGDLKLNNSFLQMCADNAAMFPMAEMARDHIKFIPDVLLVWNGLNELNDHKTIKGLQKQLDTIVRERPRYEKVESPFLATVEEDEDTYAALIGKTA